ncbi:IPT/TIG domain-containing protein [Wenjunlia tyrosinilytica]|uniref:IPT/TIG domain-containing protein n=1 Tax=Wenjunlia tyrosinilytica TaxID=1544741 RepID=A0A918A0B5_9ACTN|nr:IPT/TIG domain-containing protein [Wenjunlia tyrosinilytica]GGO99712.1 hypothetical protein GCM10012280_66800 [Wenjunlia tyrosinilytica]
MATITALSPTQSHSGVTLTITGSALGGTTKVNFGTKSVTPATVAAGTVTSVIPAGCAGQVSVSVTAGTTTSNSLPLFYIAAPAPGALSAQIGPAAPPALTITGSALSTATLVTFGAVGTAVPTVVSDSQLTVTPPVHGAFAACTDTVDLTVTSAGGVSLPIGAPGQFTYCDVPAVTGLSPTSGAAGTLGVIVSGTCLSDTSAVTFTPTGGGASVAASFTPTGPGSLLTDVPAGLAAGTYDVQVTTPGGTSAVVAADVFTVV